MSYEIECAALSSLINGGWFHGGHVLTPEDFRDQSNRAIFLRIKSLIEARREVDMFTVADGLSVDIDHIVKLYARKTNIRAYADKLKDETLRREVKKAAHAILAGQGEGREQLLQAQALLASLESSTAGDVKHVAEHVDEWWAHLGKRAEGGDWVMSGYPDVDRRLGGMRGGDLIILAGRPAMGKTALALNIATKARKRTAFFSLEMQSEGLLDRVAASLSGIPLNEIRNGKLTDQQWSTLTPVTEKIKKMPIYLDCEGGLTIQEIHSRARSMKARDGLDLVVVDYLQLIKGGNLGAYERITEISQASKVMAKDLDVPVLMLAQLSRKCEERHDKRPLASDLRDSGSIEQDADVIAFVYRDEVYDDASPTKGYAELIFRKVRQGEIGTDWFLFDGALQTFRQTDKPANTKVRVMPYPEEKF